MNVFANFIARFTPRYGHNPRRDVTEDASLARDFWLMRKAPCMLKIDPLNQPATAGAGIPMEAIKQLPEWFLDKYGEPSQAWCIIHTLTMHFALETPDTLRPFIVVQQHTNNLFVKQALIIGFAHLYTYAIMDLFFQVLYNRKLFLEETHQELIKERERLGSPRYRNEHHGVIYEELHDKLKGVQIAIRELEWFNGCGFPMLQEKK